MEILPKQQFRSPEEEIAFLKEEIARRERALLERNKDIDAHDIDTIGREVVKNYAEHEPSQLLHKDHVIPPHELRGEVELLSDTQHQFDDLMRIMREKGIRNMLSVLERLDNPFLQDEIHRELVSMLRAGSGIADLKEGAPLWNVLNMTLFEVSLPRHKDEHSAKDIKTIFSAMEQFYSGMQTLTRGKAPRHYTLEIAVSDKRDEIIFYVGVPNEFVNLFEKQALSLFPNAVLTLQQNDYNIFVEGGVSHIAHATFSKHASYPLKTYTHFETDPLSVLLNAFSKIERDGGGASIQVVIQGGSEGYQQTYNGIIKRLEKGESKEVAIRKSTFTGSMFEELKSFAVATQKKPNEPSKPKEIDTALIEVMREKLETPVQGVNIRIAVSARTDVRASQILTEIESSFHQFENMKGNKLSFNRLSGGKKEHELHAFSFREYDESRALPLSIRELSTIIHFPAEGIESSPQFKQSRAKHAPAPVDLPQHGTMLGVNSFRNIDTKIYLTPADRLRHFYVIGQTGTGKTTLLKNMIIQDIKDGAGVCMIDPHGTDIVDVLAQIPPERMDDLIYFDPSNMERSIGLNMLEFDPRYPEQKTFVVNEIFSIFQKLYGAVPESLGPMFEQYFRNSTLLILEDPESGSTLLDISRVMSDALYRRMKLSKATNPVVVQFWTQIANKAGGESSLENIIPYITSKTDPLTANDYLRPIIGQQHSTFDFRDIMDSRKILLVNLSKGRLGEINANLIGMIIVGKILMAALSRVDSLGTQLPPFYLYIDEFQNVTTNSISAILSEARKYGLGLTIAHQFLAQIDDGIRDAVFGNVGSMSAFRVGPEDAAVLEKQFSPTFTASDLMNIENHNGYVRMLADGSPTPPFSIHTMRPDPTDHAYAKELMEYSLLKYGTPRAQVEADIRARYQM